MLVRHRTGRVPHAWFLVGLCAVAACSGRVGAGDAAVVAAQGPEITGVPVGEFHRAGQVCGACHAGGASAAPSVFTVSGTILSGGERRVGVDAAEVQMTDAAGTRFVARTNCVGNFFVTRSEWSPVFPLLVRVVKGSTSRVMQEPIVREASCASCHASIDLFPSGEPGGEDKDCPVDPVLGR
jgi:hypothetical protein